MPAIVVPSPLMSAEELDKILAEHLRGNHFLRPALKEAVANRDMAVVGLEVANGEMRDGFAKITNALTTVDRTISRELHFMKVREAAEKWLDKLAPRLAKARQYAEADLRAVEKGIEEDLAFDDNGKRSAEIRAHLKSLDNAARINVAMEAIEKGDDETMAAFLSGPAFLSGYSDEQRAIFEARFTEKWSPELSKRRAVLKLALDIHEKTFNELLNAQDGMFPRPLVAEIEAAGKVGAEARAAVMALSV